MHTKYRNLKSYSKNFDQINWGTSTPPVVKKKKKVRDVNIVIHVK